VEVLTASAGVRWIEIRVFRNAELHLEPATFRNEERVVTGFGDFREERAHFLGWFEPEFRAVAKALFIHDHGSGAYAD
jgi:hypothetical protein